MRKNYFLPLVFFLLIFNIAQAQVPTNGDCLGAIPVCTSVYTYNSSATGPGLYNDVPYQGPASNDYCTVAPYMNCIAYGEVNSTWYIFTTQTAGNIAFTIDPVDNADDYDWALYNLTTNDCSNIPGGGMTVRCNYCGSPGNTGAGGSTQICTGPYWPGGCNTWSSAIPTVAGQTYALMVNNFSGSFNGYTINFGASTAGIVDNVPPYMTSLTTPVPCGSNTLNIAFNENIRCSSITGSDFTLTGPGGPYTVSYVSGPSCLVGGAFENTFTLTVVPDMTTGGTYTLWLSGAVLDNCNNASNPANANNSRNFTITAPAGSVSESVSSVCDGGPVTFTATATTGAFLGFQYQWNGTGGAWTDWTTANPYTWPSGAGGNTLYVRGVFTSGPCSAFSAPVSVYVTPIPVGNILANPINIGTLGCTAYSDTKNNSTTNCFGNEYSQASDDIYYMFTLPVAATVNISHCGSGFDTYMHLLNSAGVSIATNDDNGVLCAGAAASLQVALAAGTYYVVSEGWSTNAGNITTQISRVLPVGTNTGNPISVGTLTCSSYSNTQNNNTAYCFGNDIGQASDDIYYSFTLAANTIVDISHCGSGFDTYMYLLNSGGTPITSNDDYGPLCSATTASLEVNLAAGSYYVVSEGYSGNNGNITTQISIPTPSGGSISGNNTVCYNTNGVTYSVAGALTTAYYDWSVPAGASIASGQGTNTISVNCGTAASGNITCVLRNGPCTGPTLSYAVTIVPSTCWIGVTSTDWFTASNWCLGGIIPQTTTDIIIPDGAITPNDPNINAAGAVCRNITMQAGSITNITGSNPLSVYGNWSDAGVFNEATGVVNFVGNIAQQITTPETFYDLNLNNANGLTLTAANTISDRLILTNGTFTNGGNLTMANNATIERFVGSLANAPTFGANINLVYRATVTSGPEIPVSTSVLRNIDLNAGAAGIVTLNTPATLNNQFTFTTGVMRTTAANVLIFADNSTYLGAANNRFIDGPVSKTGDDAFEFPTGDIVGATWVWAPVSIADPGANTTDRFTAQYFFTSSPNNWLPTDMCNILVLDHTSGVEYWDLQRISGTIYPDVTLFWKDANRSGITSLVDLTTAHWETCSGPLKWVSKGGVGAGTLGVGGTGQITGTGFTAYSPVTFGAKKGTTNPLPVSLLNFYANCLDQVVHLSWSTVSETNNDFFTVERSPDLNIWDELGNVDGAGNSNMLRTYSYDDYSPLEGTSYYRLKQTDYDGKYEVFNPVSVECTTGDMEPSVTLYPNPFTDEVFVKINNFTTDKVSVIIFDVLGNKVFDKQFNSETSDNPSIVLNLKQLSSGIYFVNFLSEQLKVTSKLIKNP
jgi:hypothetical protein